MSSRKDTTNRDTTESQKDYFKFLGTAGARFVMAKQLRASGGLYLELQGQRIALDPGPGALLRMAHSRPPIEAAELEAVIVTHKHIDHSNDANVLLDAMTAGGLKRRGVFMAPAECLEGPDRVLLPYLKKAVKEIIPLEPETTYHLGSLKIRTSVRHLHEAETYGLKFYLPQAVLGIMVDTKYFPELAESYRDCRYLVMNVLRVKRPENDFILHLTVPEATELIRAIKPEKVFLTHFGQTMLKANPRLVAENMTGETGAEVVAAYDGMKVEIG